MTVKRASWRELGIDLCELSIRCEPADVVAVVIVGVVVVVGFGWWLATGDAGGVVDCRCAQCWSVVGHVLYREGIVFFPKALAPANRDLDSNTITYNQSISSNAKWIYFGGGANDGFTHHSSHASASYSINFEGTTYKNTMTMLCHANKGELNYSNNPTFLNINHSASIVGHSISNFTYLDNETEIKNIASSSFHRGEDDFRKVTYISKVGIYDEDNNLLMTVDLARPYKKEEKDNFTFKIKYDLL